jgi:hypothetical protein
MCFQCEQQRPHQCPETGAFEFASKLANPAATSALMREENRRFHRTLGGEGMGDTAVSSHMPKPRGTRRPGPKPTS